MTFKKTVFEIFNKTKTKQNKTKENQNFLTQKVAGASFL